MRPIDLLEILIDIIDLLSGKRREHHRKPNTQETFIGLLLISVILTILIVLILQDSPERLSDKHFAQAAAVIIYPILCLISIPTAVRAWKSPHPLYALSARYIFVHLLIVAYGFFFMRSKA